MRVFPRFALLLTVLLAGARPVLAQVTPDPPIPLTAASTDCSTASSCAVLTGPANGVAVALSPVGGTFQAEFEITYNGGRLWSALDMFPPGSTTAVEAATAAGSWRGAAGGLVRVRLSSCTNCSVLVTMTPLAAVPTSGGGGGGGGGAATTDADDASIAVGQTNDNVNSFTNVYDGSVWRRLTIGTAGTASAQVLTVQGIASGTNLNVTCSNCSGTGVSVNEDVASADAQPGTPAYTVRNDTVTGATGTDGDYQPMKSDAAGRTYVTGTGGTFPASGTAATDAAVSGNPVYVAGRASAAAPAAVSTDGDVVPPWLLLTGAAAVQPTFAGVLGAASNGATNTGTQRVTISSDSTGMLASVTAVGSISTSVTPGTAAANLGKAEDAAHTSADTGVMDLTVRTDTAAALAGTTNDYQPFITDVLGKLWVTGSYAEDAAHADGETGVLGLAVRRDADTSLVGTDGDRAPFQVNAGGQLKVACIAGCSGSTFADNAAFTFGTTVVQPIAGVFDDVASNTATENSAAIARITANKALHVNLRTAAGVELTPATDVTEDAAETAGGTGPAVMSVRRDTQASSAGTTGDNATFNTDALGNLWVSGTVIEDAAETAGGQLSLAGSVRRDTQASSAGTTGDNATVNTDAIGNLWVTGTVIEDAAETAGGQLSLAGSVRRDVLASSSGASGDNSTINTTSNGALWVAQPDPCSFGTKVYVNINQTTGTQLFTGTASNRTYVCSINLVTATAQNIALVSGTGTVCATGIAGMMGGSTAATGWNFAANGGIVVAGGNAAIAKSAANADNVCLLTSSTGQISGNIVYVVAP